MKTLITLTALLSFMPLAANAYIDNIYGNGGVETASFATKAEAISAANKEKAKLETMTSEQLAFSLRTPQKNLRYKKIQIWWSRLRIVFLVATALMRKQWY